MVAGAVVAEAAELGEENTGIGGRFLIGHFAEGVPGVRCCHAVRERLCLQPIVGVVAPGRRFPRGVCQLRETADAVVAILERSCRRRQSRAAAVGVEAEGQENGCRGRRGGQTELATLDTAPGGDQNRAFSRLLIT